jgi:hypothetical protein
MTTGLLEAFLAKIYVDAKARARFLTDPTGEAVKAGLTQSEVDAVAGIDRVGLELISQSLEQKRRGHFRRPAE